MYRLAESASNQESFQLYFYSFCEKKIPLMPTKDRLKIIFVRYFMLVIFNEPCIKDKLLSKWIIIFWWYQEKLVAAVKDHRIDSMLDTYP